MKSLLTTVFRGAANLLRRILPLFCGFFLVELLSYLALKPASGWGLAFGALWALMLSCFVCMLSRLAGRIVFGLAYYFVLAWTLAQIAYCSIFDRMMWLSEMFYAGEGAGYLGDVLGDFPVIWWIGGILLLALGVLLIWCFPKRITGTLTRLPYLFLAVVSLVALCFLPEMVFLRDLDVWGTRSEYGQSSSYRATYNTMYNAEKVYQICGFYQLTARDIWVHELYPLTPGYRRELNAQTQEINTYFAQRDTGETNEMTGVFSGKNVILVLMESIDDWMVTPEDTPTLCKLMAEGISFTNFYTPGFGTARTLNTEFCMNTGVYLPTTGGYVFDYVTNDYSQSLASQMTETGYSAQVFHYNSPSFYSRGVLEPALGYEAYRCYEDYEKDKNRLYDDCLLFENQELSDIFFREGKTLNTIITRSAHLSYRYNEVLSNYALKQYPAYRGKYGSEEENCARVKAKLVDDMFARLLQELEERGLLEDTVIIGISDHYTYGYKNMNELYTLSGVEEKLLLEKTPCFVWSSEKPSMQVEKTMSTADFLPTMLNLFGVESPYAYLGRDAFDPGYYGYALFPDGSWICDGVACLVDAAGNAQIVQNEKNLDIDESDIRKMAALSQEYIRISNLLLTANYYQKVQ